MPAFVDPRVTREFGSSILDFSPLAHYMKEDVETLTERMVIVSGSSEEWGNCGD